MGTSQRSLFLVDDSPLKPDGISPAHDLLTSYGLKGVYDTFVRPYHKTRPDASLAHPALQSLSITKAVGGDDAMGGTPAPSSSSLSGRARFEKSFRGFILDCPGRNTIKRDTFDLEGSTGPNTANSFMAMVQAPESQSLRPEFTPFDQRTLERAFDCPSAVETGPIPDFDMSIFAMSGGPDDPDASGRRKKRKKRREESLAHERLSEEPARAATATATPVSVAGATQVKRSRAGSMNEREAKRRRP